MKFPAFLIGLTLVVLTAAPRAEAPSADIGWNIRREATEHSQIMKTLHVLTDVYGPRLTGSPNLKQAGEWAAHQLEQWGLVNAHLEPWNFGHPGWLNERFTAHITSPVKDALVGEVLAWTPSTAGVVRAAAMQVSPPDRPTAEALTAFLDSVGDRVKDRIVLVGPPKVVGVTILPPAKRLDDNEVKARFDPVNPTPSPFANQAPVVAPTGQLTANQVNERVDDFLVAHHAAVRVNDGGRDHGQIRAFNNRTFDVARTVPTIILRNEDFGRIWRLLADQRDVQLEVEVVNHTYPEGTTAYNTVAEIPGTDKAGEVVMLGAHLDSWHAATGATDNAIGSSIMMEAARILKAIGVTPRRTIRIALWSGEEQGLLGSKAYVAQHFGTAEAPTPEFAGFNGYINIDSGTGRVRGLSVFGPPSRRRRAPPGGRAAGGSRYRRRDREQVAQAGRHGQHVVQRRGTSGHQQRAGPDRIPVLHVAHEPRHLRARDRRRRAEGGDRGGDNGVRAGDAGRATPPLHGRRDAEAGGACTARPERTSGTCRTHRTCRTCRTYRTYRTYRT